MSVTVRRRASNSSSLGDRLFVVSELFIVGPVVVMADPAAAVHRGHLVRVQVVLSDLLEQALNDDPEIDPERDEGDRNDDDDGDDAAVEAEHADDGNADDDEDQSDAGQHDADHGDDEPRQEHAPAADGGAPDEHDVDDDEEHLEANHRTKDGSIALNKTGSLLSCLQPVACSISHKSIPSP